MNWYLGSIQDAIAASKRRKAFFIVYVEGSDELSTTMSKVLDSPEISRKFESNNFVAIKLVKDSEGHKQFEAFYKLVPVPSLFFIDQNGSPVEIVVSDNSEEIVLNKVNNAIEKCAPKSKSNAPSSETSVLMVNQPSTSTASISSDFIAAEASGSSAMAELSTSSTLSSSSTLKLSEESSPQQPAEKMEVPIEERVEKAKILLEKKREEKAAEEKKKEKEAELERRRVGQELLQAKRDLQDRELRQLKEERERAKKEEALARQRIRDQIAQDRADRAQRQSMISKTTEEEQPASTAPPPPPTSSANVNIARLQFKLPSGETRSHNFTPETTISQVRQFIDNNIVMPFGSNYQLATTFPRREFTARDSNRDLRELQLLPSAVILIIPTHGSLNIRSSFGWTQMLIDMFWDLAQPVISLSRYVSDLIFGRRNGNTAPRSDTSTTSRSGGTSTSSSSGPTGAAAAPTYTSSMPQRLGGTTTIKKRGNVYSLRDQRNDDKDDNNTWNGNSTQQM